MSGLSDEGARVDLNDLVKKEYCYQKVKGGILIMFLNNLAISWHLTGNSGDYLAIES